MTIAFLYLISVKKMQVSSIYQPNDWYKSDKPRMFTLPLVYASKSFLPHVAHQPQVKPFMDHLDTIVMENPEYAQDCGMTMWNGMKLEIFWKLCGGNSRTTRTIENKKNVINTFLHTARSFINLINSFLNVL